MMFREQQGTVSKYFRTYFDIAISMYAACWLVIYSIKSSATNYKYGMSMPLIDDLQSLSTRSVSIK